MSLDHKRDADEAADTLAQAVSFWIKMLAALLCGFAFLRGALWLVKKISL